MEGLDRAIKLWACEHRSLQFLQRHTPVIPVMSLSLADWVRGNPGNKEAHKYNNLSHSQELFITTQPLHIQINSINSQTLQNVRP